MGPVLHWLFLFGFWLALSGVFDAVHVGLGLVATLAVTLFARPLARVGLGRAAEGESIHLGQIPWPRILAYSLWLLRAIVQANWQVVRIVLDPRLPIDPALVRVPTRVNSDTGITLLANSITATPGTITVRAADEENHEFLIHTLTGAEQVAPAVHAMEDRILAALGPLEKRE